MIRMVVQIHSWSTVHSCFNWVGGGDPKQTKKQDFMKLKLDSVVLFFKW